MEGCIDDALKTENSKLEQQKAHKMYIFFLPFLFRIINQRAP